MVSRYGLRDDQWEKVKDMLPGREETVGGDAKGPPVVCRNGGVSVSRKDPAMGLACTVWGLPGRPHAPYALELKRCVEAGV